MVAEFKAYRPFVGETSPGSVAVQPLSRSKKIRRAIFLAVGAGLYRLDQRADYQKFDPGWIDLTQQDLILPRLDAVFDGYRLAHISDIHIGTWVNRARLSALVEMVNQQSPDLIVITGDFVSFKPEWFVEDLAETLRALTPHDATLAVLGNHDHWNSPRLIRQVLRESGIVEVNNAVYSLQRDKARLHIAGVDDVLLGLDRLDRVLAQLPAEGAAILLAHEPDFADTSAACGRFDLQLSGHSHGGQVLLPYGLRFLPPLGVKYPLGLYRLNGMAHYTNRGVGTSVARLRFNCRPEIAVFILRTAP